MIRIFYVFAFLLGLSSFAQDIFQTPVLIATLSSDIDSRITQILLQTDTNVGITHLITSRDRIQNAFPIANLNEGIVFLREQGRNIFTFQSDLFDPLTGGHLTLKFMKNGLIGKYKQVELELRLIEGDLKLFHQNKAIKKMKAIGNHSMGQVVGIKEFQFSE